MHNSWELIIKGFSLHKIVLRVSFSIKFKKHILFPKTDIQKLSKSLLARVSTANFQMGERSPPSLEVEVTGT